VTNVLPQRGGKFTSSFLICPSVTACKCHVLGPAAGKLVRSGDSVADHEGRAKFVTAYQAGHKIVQEGENRALEIGSEQWPFPIPIVRRPRISCSPAAVSKRHPLAWRAQCD